MTHAELDREIERLHRVGDREAVVTLMRKYGLFENEEVVRQYLSETRTLSDVAADKSWSW